MKLSLEGWEPVGAEDAALTSLLVAGLGGAAVDEDTSSEDDAATYGPALCELGASRVSHV